MSKPYYYRPQPVVSSSLEADICIYGANAGGIIAAVQALRLGRSVVVVEPGGHLGGMTTSGLSYTDTGKSEFIGGLARQFYRRCGRHYGVDAEWRFEPKMARQVLADWIEELGIPVHFHQYLERVTLADGERRIREIRFQSGLSICAAMFIDATYEGDLMAAAAVPYAVGREGNEIYGEQYNGAYLSKSHQFDLAVDPYIIPGDVKSGLLPGITDEDIIEGAGDRCVQAYNFRLCVTQRPDIRIPFEQPEGYDPMDYELLGRYYQGGWNDRLLKFDVIQGGKVDMNNSGAVSTDFIGQNFDWPEATYEERETIYQNHVRYQKGLMWFRGNDPRVPQEVRKKILTWGLAGDEFEETGGWPPQLYVRESRRMIADVVMTEQHCFGESVVSDPVGMATYPLDSHNCRRFVRDGRVLNEGNVEVAVKPFSISWRSIIPAQGQVENLLVPTCLSASHTAYGSIRMEPVFMILGEAAATGAALALDSSCAIQDVAYEALRKHLEQNGGALE